MHVCAMYLGVQAGGQPWILFLWRCWDSKHIWIFYLGWEIWTQFSVTMPRLFWSLKTLTLLRSNLHSNNSLLLPTHQLCVPSTSHMTSATPLGFLCFPVLTLGEHNLGFPIVLWLFLSLTEPAAWCLHSFASGSFICTTGRFICAAALPAALCFSS